jgi:hypothetical protein
MSKQRVEKWERWMKSIQNDVHRMYLHRYVWKRMMEIATENPDVKNVVSYFWNFQFDIYVNTQAGAVRRQADVNSQVASLGQLLSEIAETPDLLTHDWYLEHWRDESYDDSNIAFWRRAGEKEWAEKYAVDSGEHVAPRMVEADLAELRDESEKVRRYVDKYVAHSDKTVIGLGSTPASPPDDFLPSLDEVHQAIDLIGRLFLRYNGLFSSADIFDLTPMVQHDWEAVFRVQWLPDLELPKEMREYKEQRLREGVDLDAD